MSSRGTVRTWVWSLAVLLVTVMVGAKAPAIGEEQTVAATASLVREIQFMLLNVGIRALTGKRVLSATRAD